MVYSDSFGDIPDAVRESIYKRLFGMLTGDAAIDRFARLSATALASILNIVRKTRSGPPDYWRARR
jgi:hypothetical protein